MPLNRSETTPSARIPNLANQIEQLRAKLVGFVVRDNQGGYVGEVRDVQYNPTEQLNLIVALTDRTQQEQLFKLSGKVVRQVDAASRSLLTHLHPAEVLQLPLWQSETASQSQTTFMENVSMTGSSAQPQVVEEVAIPLLEERLVVERNRRKIGEIVVRKEIVTEMVQVPVRREKLIVEQAGPETKQIAVIDLAEDETRTPELPPFVNGKKEVTVQAEFTSLEVASRVLNAIASQPESGCQQVQIAITLSDPGLVSIYQDWLSHYAQLE